MAEATATKKQAEPTNWADMEHEEEDDQEIGIQAKQPATQEGTAAAEENKEGAGEATQATEGDGQGKDGKYPPRKKRDYGDKYDPNYKKKGPWRKGQQYNQGEEIKRVQVAPQNRTKTERGDYVVTSFQIPDRVSGKGDKKELTDADKQKKRRVGAFQLDDSDLEEEEQAQQATEEVEAPVQEAVPEEKKEVPAPVQEK